MSLLKYSLNYVRIQRDQLRKCAIVAILINSSKVRFRDSETHIKRLDTYTRL